MFQYYLSLMQSGGSINTNLDYVSGRMNTILESMLQNEAYKGILNIFCELGIFALLIYFLVDLLDRVTDMQFNLEILFRQLVKFVAFYAIITHIPQILNGFNEFMKGLNTIILTEFGTDTSSTYIAGLTQHANIVNGAVDMKAEDAGGILQGISAIGTQIIMQFLTWTLSIDRALRIGYKSILAPIGCADMVTNGMSSNGIRYLKSILALYLQSPIMLIMMICVNEVCAGLGTATIWSVFVGLFILWNTTKRTKEIADEII